jgi:hypothetical protein
MRKIKDKDMGSLMRKVKQQAKYQHKQQISNLKKQEKFNLEQNHHLEEKNKLENLQVILMKVLMILMTMVI